jgi:hypothetical protein
MTCLAAPGATPLAGATLWATEGATARAKKKEEARRSLPVSPGLLNFRQPMIVGSAFYCR